MASPSVVLYELALQKLQSEDYLGALENLNDAVKINPEYIDALLKRGYLQDQISNPESEVYRKKFLDMQKQILIWQADASNQEQSNKLKELIQKQSKLSQDTPYYQQLALQDYSKVILLEPSNIQAYYLRSRLLVNLGNLQASLADANKLLSLDRRNPDAYFNLGFVHYKLKNFPEAIRNYNLVLELSPDYTNLHFYLAIAYEYSASKSNALEEYNKAIQQHPNHAAAYAGRGRMRLSFWDLMGALQDFYASANVHKQSYGFR